jgi:hypothetical protein
MPLALRSALSPKLPAPASTPKPVQNALPPKPANASAAPTPNKASTKAAGLADIFADVFEGTKPAPNKQKPTASSPFAGVSVSGTAQVGTKSSDSGQSIGGSITTETSRNTSRSVNRSGTFGGPSSNTAPEKPNTSASATIFSVGDKINEGLSAGNEDVGTSIGAEASYKAEVTAGKDGVHVDIGGEVRSGAEAHASITEGPFTIGVDAFIGGRAGAGVKFDAGPDGFRAGAYANAFLGIEGSVHGTIDTEYGSVTGTLTGQLGVGADAHANVLVTPDGRLKYDVGAGFALGLGGKAGLSGELDLVELAEDAQQFAEQAVDAVEPYVEAAENAVETVQETAENVAEAAQDVAENVAETAQDVGEAVAGFFGF